MGVGSPRFRCTCSSLSTTCSSPTQCCRAVRTMTTPSKPAFVHESSYVDEEVSIGRDTQIWHFCHVLTGSKIGERCRIGQNVVIGPRAEVGNNVKVQNNVSIYEGVTLED